MGTGKACRVVFDWGCSWTCDSGVVESLGTVVLSGILTLMAVFMATFITFVVWAWWEGKFDKFS